MVNKMAQGCGLKLAVLYEKYKMETDFRFAAHAVLPQSRGREGGSLGPRPFSGGREKRSGRLSRGHADLRKECGRS